MSVLPPRRLLISRSQLGQMQDHVVALAPEEACGLLAGEVEGDTCQALRMIPMHNMLHSPVQYRMEPSEQLAAFNEIEAGGMELVGIYHSHPTGPEEPSPVDVAEAYYPEVVYLIWTRKSDAWQCKGYSVYDRDVCPVEILVNGAE